MAKLKELDGIKLNDLVVTIEDGRFHKVVRIDGHVFPVCLDDGGRYETCKLEVQEEVTK